METVHYNYGINRKLHSILTAKLPRLCDIMVITTKKQLETVQQWLEKECSDYRRYYILIYWNF